MRLSVVSPVYEAEQMIDELVRQVIDAVDCLSDEFELILVEDGSRDKSWKKIEENCARDSRVKGIKLSRNFGQHQAVTAGIAAAKGDALVIMDCDLQDDPIFITKMLAKLDEGYDIIFTRRMKRKDTFSKKAKSWLYKRIFNLLSDRKYKIDGGSLVAFTRKVAEAVLLMKDKDRLYLQMLKWVGFRSSTLEIAHRQRPIGSSSYNLGKLLRMGVQGWTSNSFKLLRFSIYLGFLMAFFSILASLYVLFRYFMFDLLPGWPSLIIATLFSTGLIMLSIGITGIYIGKIFDQVRDRPLFIIDEKVNFNA